MYCDRVRGCKEDYDTVFVLQNLSVSLRGKRHKASEHYERAVSIGVEGRPR